MDRQRPSKVGYALLAFILFINLTQASEKCRSGCTSSTHKHDSEAIFKYEVGSTYKYSFEGSVQVSVSSAENQETTTRIKGNVLLTQLTECNQLLRLQNVQIIGSDAKKYGHLSNIEKAVRINFHNGHIEDVICIENGDTQDSLNLKRAIASLFQTNPKQSYETDVFGVCPTEIVVHKEGKASTTIQKRRNLNLCSHRETIKQGFLTTTFNFDSEIKTSPILSGQYDSEQRIKNGIIEHVTVTENYLYMPFSIGKSGARAVVNMKLQYISLSKENPTSKVSEGRSIIFENPHLVNTEKSNVDAIITILKQTRNTPGNIVGEKTAKEFLDLIKILKVSKKDDILSVYGQIKSGAGFKDKSSTRRMYLDGVFRAGTGDTIEAGITLLKNNELNPLEQKLLYLGLAFVSHATIPSVSAATSLLDEAKLPREAYLGVGILAGRYCSQHECEKVDAVQKLMKKFVAKIGDGKADNRDKENDIIYSLKSIANMKYLDDGIVGKIVSMAQDKKAAARLRVAALEAFKSNPCLDKVRDSALNILKDVQQDSEIRIKAYLVVAECPNGKVAGAVKSLLENEASFQVGGFIVSHLRNLKASTNPDKALAKQQLGNIIPSKRYPIDPRKYSFNTEFSYAFDTVGLANTIDSDVVFSQESFLPRSVNLNLTTELFGHTVNLLELGARQENLDKVMEHYMGPLGALQVADPRELVNSGRTSLEKVFQQIRSRFSKIRGKRDVSKADVQGIAKQVQIKEHALDTDLDLDLSVKLFGSEVAFLSFNDNADTLKPEVIIDKIFDSLDKGIDKLKQFKESFQTNVLFLDSEFSYPTSMGYPLKLGVEGTSTIQVDVSGQVDLRAIWNPQSGSNIKLVLIPSANVEVAGSLTLDTSVLENGLKVRSNLYTATGMDLSVDLFNHKSGVDVKLALPIEKQHVLTATHDIVFTARELGRPEVDIPVKFSQNKDFSICVDNLVPYLGVTLCGDINTPMPASKAGITPLPFPLSGNAKVSLRIEKEDLSYFHLKDLLITVPETDRYGREFLFEVIGAKNDNKLSVIAEAFALPEKYFKAELKSAVVSASTEGRIINNNNEKSIMLKGALDQNVYLAKLGVSISGSPSKKTYKPIIEIKMPHGDQKLPYNVEGAIIVEESNKGTKYTFDKVKLVMPDQRAMQIEGNLGMEGAKLFTDVKVSEGAQFVSLKGDLESSDKIKLNGQMQNSYNPQANFKLSSEFERPSPSWSYKFNLIHGQDFNSKTNKITASASVKSDRQNQHYGLENKFSYPLLGISYSVEGKCTKFAYDYEIDFNYKDQIKVGSEMDLQLSEKRPGEYKFDFEVYGFENKLEIKSKRDIHGDKSKMDHSVEINGKKMELSGTLLHQVKSEELKIAADFTLKVPGHKEVIKISDGFTSSPSDLDVYVKVTSGSNTYVDATFKASKVGNVNGNLKVSIKDLVEASGAVKMTKGSGTGNILVNLVRLGRKIKAESTLTIAEPTYNVLLTFYPNFEKDNNNKIVLSTSNVIKLDDVDSKNWVQVLGNKVEVNVKAAAAGGVNDRKDHGEVEVVLPAGHHFSTKWNRELKMVEGVINGAASVSFEQRDDKSKPARKALFKWTGDQINPKGQTFNNNYQLDLDDGQGKDLKTSLVLKRLPMGDKHVVEISAKAGGSALPNEIETSSNIVYKKNQGDYNVNCKYGKKVSLVVKGKYDIYPENKPCTGDLLIELKTPAAKITSVKFTTDTTVEHPKSDDDALGVKSSLALVVDSTDPNSAVNLQGKGEVHFSASRGQVKFTGGFQKEDPITVDLKYQKSDSKGAESLKSDLLIEYAKNKRIKSDLTYTKPNEQEYTLDLKVDTPNLEKTQSNRLQVHTRKDPNNKKVNSEMVVSTDGKTYTFTTNYDATEISPSFNLQLKYPNGKVDQIAAAVTKITDKEIAGNLKLNLHEKDFALTSSIDAKVASVDDFGLKLAIDSAALKLDKIVVDARSKGARGGKKIEVSATSSGKNLLQGTMGYKAREEGGKFIIEGSGTFKVKDESKEANFKYIKRVLTVDKDTEAGVEFSFNAGLGSRAVDAELKSTNKQFRILTSYCEETKQCAHIEVDSKSVVTDVSDFVSELEIAIDLRKLGLSHEFGLKSFTTRKNFLLDHTVDIHFQNKDNKYQYSLYVRPKEAGVSLTTPARVIALESKCESSSTKSLYPIHGEIAVYLNKKAAPSKKTSLSYKLDVDNNERGTVLVGEVKFVNPALEKDLVASVNGKYDVVARSVDSEIVLDVFAKANQKIVLVGKASVLSSGDKYGFKNYVSVKSDGLNIQAVNDEEFSIDTNKKIVEYKDLINWNVAGSKQDSFIKLYADTTRASLDCKLLNKDLIRAKAKLNLGKDKQTIELECHIIGCRDTVDFLEIKNLNTIKYEFHFKNSPNDKITVNAGFIPGQIADLRAEVSKNNAKHDLLHASIKLDETNFLKSDYGFNLENVQKLVLDEGKKEMQNFANEIKSLNEVYNKEVTGQAQKVNEIFHKNLPNLKPLNDYYQSELAKLREELVSDKTIKEALEFFKNLFGAAAQTLNEILIKISDVAEKTVKTLQAQFGNVLEMIDKEILPELRAIATGIVNVVADLFQRAIDLVFTYLSKLSQIIDAHQKELKDLATAITAMGQELARFFAKLFEQTRTVITKEWNALYEELKALPITEEIKTQYNELMSGMAISEPIINTVKETAATIKDMAPTYELKELVALTGNYIEMKMRGQKIDDLAELDKIVKMAIEAVRKLLFTLSKDFDNPERPLPLPWTSWKTFPKFVTIKLSPLNYLFSGDLPQVADFLYSISLNPLHWIPPYKLHAVVAQGQHIFTFDGRHMTFPGKCDYLWSGDALNGNFTIIGTYTDGLLTGVTFADKSDIVTLKKDRKATLNNAAAELPIRKPQLEVFAEYNRVTIVSKAGVKIVCGTELLVCGVHVSGFYHGRLRGLLGNGNSEPYDDLTLPNGKIVTSESDFGNAYKVGSKCAPVKTVDHAKHGHNPTCTKLFSADSILGFCFNFVDPAPYVQACEHGLAGGVKDTEKAIAIAYVASCRSKNVPIRVPDQFVKCTNGEKAVDLGEKFSVKTPLKAADIVVVIDQIKSNEPLFKDFVQPLLTQIVADLGAKGISDVEFHLIGYGGEYVNYPSHYTTDGGKLAFNGKPPHLKFAEPPKQPEVITGCTWTDGFLKQMTEIVHEINLITGNYPQARSFEQALLYPFRAHAVKSIIAVTGQPCEQSRMLLLQKLRTLLFDFDEISLTLVTPFEEIVVHDAKQTKNALGFNSKNVFLVTDAKKKPLGSPDLRSGVLYDDFCVDFTVKSDGNVFITNNILQAKGGAKKQTVLMASANIVDRLANVEQLLDCQCKWDGPYSGRNTCSVSKSTEKPIATGKLKG